MYYKNTPLAFLFITIVGILCIIGVALFGEKGIFILIVLVFHPLFVEKLNSKPDESFWRLNFRIGIISFLLTGVTFTFIYLSSRLFLTSSLKLQEWHYIFFPYFAFVTGLVGLFYSNKK